jgi:hypothetical protein
VSKIIACIFDAKNEKFQRKRFGQEEEFGSPPSSGPFSVDLKTLFVGEDLQLMIESSSFESFTYSPSSSKSKRNRLQTLVCPKPSCPFHQTAFIHVDMD